MRGKSGRRLALVEFPVSRLTDFAERSANVRA
jgi:hypothetical protein